MPVLGSGGFQNVVVAGSWNDPERLRSLRRCKQLLAKRQRNHFIAISLHEQHWNTNPANLGE